MGVSCSNSAKRKAPPIEHQEIHSAIVDHQKLEKDYDYLSNITHFDIETIRKLHVRFCEIDEDGNSDDLIDIQELVLALGLKASSLLGQRIFAYFDKHDTGGLNFRNFVMALNGLSKQSSLEEKIKLSFFIYDINQDGSIDADEIRSLVDAALEMTPQITWTEQQRRDICDATFKDVDSNGDGIVQYDEYAAYCRLHPGILSSLTIDVREIVKDGAEQIKRHEDENLVRSLTRGPLDDEGRKKKSKSMLKKMFRRSKVDNLREIANHEDLMTNKLAE